MLVTVTVASLFAVPVKAAEWEKKAALRVGSIYTDNVCLTPDEKIDKWIATATPSGALYRRGGRSELDLRFSLAFNTLAESSLDCPDGRQGRGGVSNISPAPRLTLLSQTEVVQDWFYFDAQGFAGQNLVNAFAPGGGDEINASGNINTTYSYSLSPYLYRRINERYDVLLRYTFDQRLNTSDFVRDSIGHRVQFDAGLAPERNAFSYGVTADYYEVTYAEFRGRPEVNTKISSVRLRGAYQIDRKWALYGTVGVDKNDFLSSFDNIDDTAWDAGVVWTPNTRVRIEAGTGQRFFGSTPRASVSYRHKRSDLQFEYKRELTYTRNLRVDNQIPGGNLPDFGGEDPGFSGTPTTLSAQPIVTEGYALRYTLHGVRNTLGASASRSDQSRAVDGRNSDFTNYRVFWRYRLSGKSNLTARVSYAERDGQTLQLGDDDLLGPVRASNTWMYYLGLDRKTGRRSRIIASYQYRDRQSEQELDSYQENRFTIAWQYDFRT